MNEPLIEVDFDFDFSVVRVMEDQILPTRLNGVAHIVIGPDADEEMVNNGIERVQFWIRQIVDGAIMFCPHNDIAMSMIYGEEGPRFTNLIIMTPDEPLDEHIAVLVKSKLTALGAGAFIVSSIRVKSSDAGGLNFKFSGDDTEQLPEMGDWVTVPNWFKVPWWRRCDGSTIDLSPSEKDDIKDVPEWSLNLDFLTQPIGGGGGGSGGNGPPPKDKATKFRPKVVDGGKSD
jgi:hypothetical protein